MSVIEEPGPTRDCEVVVYMKCAGVMCGMGLGYSEEGREKELDGVSLGRNIVYVYVSRFPVHQPMPSRTMKLRSTTSHNMRNPNGKQILSHSTFFFASGSSERGFATVIATLNVAPNPAIVAKKLMILLQAVLQNG